MSTNRTLALLNEMAVFAKVVETGSFSEAARQFAATPSAVSRSVSRLEKALGTRLLQRTTRKLKLSESGREVYQHCVAMVSSAQAVMATSGQYNNEPQGVVRISVPKAVGRHVIHPYMASFLTQYPKVDVQLQLDDRYIDLIEDDIDIAIRITDQPPPGLMGRRLFSIDHLLCATPQYLERQGVPEHPHDLKQHCCIVLGEEPNDAIWKFRKDGKAVSVAVKGRYAANHTGIRLDAALQHIGIASLPYFTVVDALEQGLLVQVLPAWLFKTNYSGEVWVLYPPTRHLPPKISVFIDYLVRCLEAEPMLGKIT